MASYEENTAFALDAQAQEATETVATPNPFAALGLAPELVAAIADLGFTEPTAVQQRTIPLALHALDATHLTIEGTAALELAENPLPSSGAG